MDSIQGWVDKEQVQRLSEQLMAPASAETVEEVQTEQSQESPIESPKASESPSGLVTREKVVKVVKVPLPEITKVPILQSTPAADTSNEEAPLEELSSSEEPPEDSSEISTEEPKPLMAKKAASALAQARAVAEKSGAIAKTNTTISVSPASEGERSFFETLDASLRADHGIQGLCALDRDADILYQNVQNIAWRDLLVALLKENNPYISTETPESPLHVCLRVTAKLQLQIVSTMTSRGVVVLGLFLENRLAESAVSELVVKMKG